MTIKEAIKELQVTEFSCKFIRGKPEWGFVAKQKPGSSVAQTDIRYAL